MPVLIIACTILLVIAGETDWWIVKSLSLIGIIFSLCMEVGDRFDKFTSLKTKKLLFEHIDRRSLEFSAKALVLRLNEGLTLLTSMGLFGRLILSVCVTTAYYFIWVHWASLSSLELYPVDRMRLLLIQPQTYFNYLLDFAAFAFTVWSFSVFARIVTKQSRLAYMLLWFAVYLTCLAAAMLYAAWTSTYLTLTLLSVYYQGTIDFSFALDPAYVFYRNFTNPDLPVFFLHVVLGTPLPDALPVSAFSISPDGSADSVADRLSPEAYFLLKGYFYSTLLLPAVFAVTLVLMAFFPIIRRIHRKSMRNQTSGFPVNNPFSAFGIYLAVILSVLLTLAWFLLVTIRGFVI